MTWNNLNKPGLVKVRIRPVVEPTQLEGALNCDGCAFDILGDVQPADLIHAFINVVQVCAHSTEAHVTPNDEVMTRFRELSELGIKVFHGYFGTFIDGKKQKAALLVFASSEYQLSDTITIGSTVVR